MREVAVDGKSLTIEGVVEVALGRAKAFLPDEVRDRLVRGREELEELLSKGEIAYGINTGVGDMQNVIIPGGQILRLPRNLVRSTACGLGPLLSAERPAEWEDDVMCMWNGHHFLYESRMVVDGRYKYVFNAPDVDELYDLDADPKEERDILKKSPDVARKLHADHLAFREAIGCPQPSLDARRAFNPAPRAKLPRRRVI